MKPRVNRAQTGIETAGVKHSMNPFDELAVEEAVRLRERHVKKTTPVPSPPIANITAFSAGPAKAVDVLRTALAMGADEAVHVPLPPPSPSTPSKSSASAIGDQTLEPLAIAKILRALVRRDNYDLVILGKQSIDDDAGQTGGMLAGLLGWPVATQAAKLSLTSAGEAGSEKEDVMAEVIREVDGGVETIAAPLPLVLTTDLRLNEPRYASLPNIMKAKKKPMRTVQVAELLGDAADDVLRNRLEAVSVVEPAPRKGGVKVDSVDALVEKLKELRAL